MKNTNWREITRRFHNQHCVIARSELRALGADYHTEQRRLASGEWAKLGRRVVRLVDTPVTPEQRLMAACIEAGDGSVASHQSAAWLWGLADQPRRHAVTIPGVFLLVYTWRDVTRDGRRVIAEVRRVLDAGPVVPRLATSR